MPPVTFTAKAMARYKGRRGPNAIERTIAAAFAAEFGGTAIMQ
jgi:hypothetical protein